MRRVPIALLGVLWGSTAVAGVVTFDPALVVIDPAVSTTAQVQVSVGGATTEDGTFDSVDLIIGANVQALIADFDYASVFLSHTMICKWWCPPQPSRQLGTPVYGPLGSTYVGGFFYEPVASILVGSLILDATGIPNGEYTIGVDSNRDGLSGVGLFGQLDNGTSGFGRVVVIPEPGVVVFMMPVVMFLVGFRRKRDRGSRGR